MKQTEKKFDCVEMKREGARRIYEATKDMTREEELAYWRERGIALRKKYPGLKKLDTTGD